MAELSISRLEEKIQLLLKKMQYVREENQRLQENVDQQQELLQQEQARAKDMEHQIALLKIANAQSSGEGQPAETKRALKSAINQYIHEIDNCIARLNE
ncbi:MAG: hypothetical protein EPN37_10880 [Chitinophagaceae bacterium]|jgi:biopolymer transport protein ExbB/TolQ|nr:MAG: hypothetical protein EPN37_10880 [Chitinophagaceae bacterium]